ncbi:Baculoviral IAP repeat-containing protein 5 [Blumeria hordei DH14]|uniref:Baculoviral IAP repeat-containing protein 5 n=1 Tax=Blumeria graminis f. sp. hordei (strain DH14) TaxID=546991 RepID=N1J4Z5_BLUG1|nr:Baculoviral IAP repeat-containing protein 5 [Blumeria hordei DH14]
MSISQTANHYFTHESRVASFKKAQPITQRRSSNLAGAGFFYYPTHMNPDNVACFLCHKALDGWEETDDPFVEHLKHSPDCGWAITTAIGRLGGSLYEQDPLSSKLLEARKATFADKWPHEGKKGWKCHVKQMIEGGFTYSPTLHHNDMVSCTYCSISLENWEKFDQPCSSKLNSTSRNCRAPKTSNLSVHSNITLDCVIPTTGFSTKNDEAIAAQNKTTSINTNKEEKDATIKPKKTRVKKDEPIQNTYSSIAVSEPTRSRKRKSGGLYSSDGDTNSLLPSKRISTRSRGSITTEKLVDGTAKKTSQLNTKLSRRKVRSNSRISTTSELSAKATISDKIEVQIRPKAGLVENSNSDWIRESSKVANFPGLKSSLTRTEPSQNGPPAAKPNLKPPPKPAKTRSAQANKSYPQKKAVTKRSAEKKNESKDSIFTQKSHSKLSNDTCSQISHSILSQSRETSPTRHTVRELRHRDIRESNISSKSNNESFTDNLNIIGTEGTTVDSAIYIDEVIADYPSTLQSVGCHAVSTEEQQDNKKPGAESQEVVKVPDNPSESIAIQRSTRASERKKPHSGEESTLDKEIVNTVTQLTPETSCLNEKAVKAIIPELTNTGTNLSKESPRMSMSSQLAIRAMSKTCTSAAQVDSSPINGYISDSTSRKIIPPSKNHRSEVRDIDLSRSPQSSDAENQPPSSLPFTVAIHPSSAESSRRGRPISTLSIPPHSPQKNYINYQNEQPWTALDLDTICLRSHTTAVASSNDPFGREVDQERLSKLSSLEKAMTVEKWILHNAKLAEEKLKDQCERMVGIFEREGMRAMRALEGVECQD